MNTYLTLVKEKLPLFISYLAAQRAVMAPVAKGDNNFSFEKVHNASELAVTYIPTIIPPRKYFMPHKEVLETYDRAQGSVQPNVSAEDMVLFGVHTCDIAGIQCVNLAMQQAPADINYAAHKERIAIIGLECNEYCDKHASCALMQTHMPNGGYDLFLTDIGASYICHVNSFFGETMASESHIFEKASTEDLAALEAVRAKKREIFKPEVAAAYHDLKPMFDHAVESSVWHDLDSRCVACGNCTNACPTCYCFDIKDAQNFDLNTGARLRYWDSCQNENFAQIAGGESFRKKRGNRQRHRYMRKFSFPHKKFNRYFCTGCGRCSRYCMAGISLKETVAAAAKEYTA